MGLSKIEIEEKAASVLREHQLDQHTGFDVVELAQKMGFAVSNIEMENNDDGFILVGNRDSGPILSTGGCKIIGVNRDRSLYEKRFIIAHEIGHYVLGENDRTPIYAHREKETKPKNKLEQDVDYFAACLLMPRTSFQNTNNELKNSGNKITDRLLSMQDTFKTPLESILRRFEELEHFEELDQAL